MEADAVARHAVPAVLWATPFRESRTSRFHPTASMTVGKARMSKFIANAKTSTSIFVIVPQILLLRGFRLAQTGVAVEKLIHQKMAGKTLHQETLQTTFSVF